MACNINKEQYQLPYEIKFVDPELNEQLLKDFTGEKTGFVQVGPDKWFFPSKYLNEANHFYNFESRPDDIWVTTFPRSGTTWMQEIVWLIANDLNYDGAQKEPLTKRFPFFECSIFMHEQTKKELLEENATIKKELIENIYKPAYEFLTEISSPRFIKTHFPFSLLPPSIMENKSKIIYVARNPKDVAVSFYHLNKLYRTLGYIGDFPKYWNYFESSLNPWMPYWTHIKEGWLHRNHPNVLFMFYEDMNSNLYGTIEKVAAFLNKTLTNDQIKKLTNYLSIENFRNNPSVNCAEFNEIGVLKSSEQSFVRKGKTGAWNEEFTPELREKADRWIELNLKDTDLKFP